VKQQSIKIAATGRAAYIAIDPKLLLSRRIQDWMDETASVLNKAGKSAAKVTQLNAPANLSEVKKKSKSAPAMLALFDTKEELLGALGPIVVKGQTLTLEKFRGGESCTFKISECQWILDPGVLLRAFEAQAMVRVMSWGFRTIGKTTTFIVARTELPPGRNSAYFTVGNWRLDYERLGEEVCCCCGGDHDPFDAGTKCSQFRKG
jgi:hypothetical protein